MKAKYEKGMYIKKAEAINSIDRSIEAMYKAGKKRIKNENDKIIFEIGYNTRINNEPVPEEYKDNELFKSGYERASRLLYAQEYEKNKNIVKKMAEENIPLENAPESIKNDESLVSYYKLYQMKNKSKTGKTK